MRKVIVTIIVSVTLIQLTAQQNIDEKVNELVSRLTLQEKIELLGGTGFDSKPVERLGIPAIKMADGPLGIRWGNATAFPATIALGATWDKQLAYNVGKGIAKEVRDKGRDMLLAPCVNLVRTPHGGRNFESYGEDPVLTAVLSTSYIKGVQSEDVLACIKHYAVNNQEYKRMTIDAVIDERVLREIYLPAFKSGVQNGNVATVMSAYNVLNGTYCSENDFLLNTILKNDWGFDGFVVSDWGAVHSTLGTAKYGVDIEMPNGKYLNETVTELVENGDVDQEIINDKVRRLIKVAMRFGFFDDRSYQSKEDPYDANKKLAYDAAAAGIVLLKNTNSILPINVDEVKTIALIGPNAAVNRAGGGGSSRVNYSYSVSPFDAFMSKYGDKLKIISEPGVRSKTELNIIPSQYLKTEFNGEIVSGFTGQYYNNKNLEGDPELVRVDEKIDFKWVAGGPAESIGVDNFSVRWKGKLIPETSGKFELGVASDDGVRLFINGEKVIDEWIDRAVAYNGYALALESGKEYNIIIEYYENGGAAEVGFGWIKADSQLLDKAVAAAKAADVVVVFAGLSEHYESEGYDRPDLTLPEDQLKLLAALDQLGKEHVLVINNGGQLVMPEVYANADAVLEAWFPGQEGGNAIADILTGVVNPSGKLPYTIGKKWQDYSSYDYYPEENDQIFYKDGLFIGYRHFDKNEIEADFNFGFGLSYTQFKIDDVKLSASKISSEADQLTVTCKLTNTGDVAGAEVIQLYTAYENPKVVRPEKDLKKFEKVYLEPGETRVVELSVIPSDLAYYSIEKRSWVTDNGKYYILLGSSSREQDLVQRVFEIDLK